MAYKESFFKSLVNQDMSHLIQVNQEEGNQKIEESISTKNKDYQAVFNSKAEFMLTKDGSKLRRTSIETRVRYSSGRKPSLNQQMNIFLTNRFSIQRAHEEKFDKKYPFLNSCIIKRRNSVDYFHSNSFKLIELKQKHSLLSLLAIEPSVSPKIISPTFAVEIENLSVHIGDTALFDAIITGSFPFVVTWYKNDLKINKNNRFKTWIESDFTQIICNGSIDYRIYLQLSDCSNQDYGLYTVHVRNNAGDSSCTAYLKIKGRGIFLRIKVSF